MSLVLALILLAVGTMGGFLLCAIITSSAINEAQARIAWAEQQVQKLETQRLVPQHDVA